MKGRPRSMGNTSTSKMSNTISAGPSSTAAGPTGTFSTRRMQIRVLALLMAAALLPACSPGPGGSTPPGGTSAPATATGSPQPTGSPPADAETSIPAPAPESPAPPSGPGKGNAELAIIIVPGEGQPEISYTLVCAEGVPVAESVHPAADAACAALKENAGLVSPAAPATDQACTEQYGGPQKATVTGVVDGVPVDAAFSRTNGCEISAWEAAKDVLGASGGA